MLKLFLDYIPIYAATRCLALRVQPEGQRVQEEAVEEKDTVGESLLCSRESRAMLFFNNVGLALWQGQTWARTSFLIIYLSCFHCRWGYQGHTRRYAGECAHHWQQKHRRLVPGTCPCRN